MVPICPAYRTWCKKTDDDDDDDGDDEDNDDDDDGDDAQEMNGVLSCGQTKYNIVLVVPLVPAMTVLYPLELRMKHAKSKTVL